MGRVLTRIVLGLSIVAGSLAMAGSANATVWRNFADESFCLSTGNNGSMNLGTGLVIWKCNTDLGKPVADQAWGQVTAPFNSTYVELYDMKAPAPPPFSPSSARCAGVSGGNTSNGLPIIIWSCNNATQSTDQGWHSFFQPLDSNGHQCFSFDNELALESPDRDVQVFGVSGAVMANGTPIILWDYFTNASGQSTHPDQIWCAY